MIGKKLDIFRVNKDDWQLSLTLTNKLDIERVQKLIGTELLDITIKKFRKKRSLDANAYMWQLLTKLAIVLSTTKDELYVFSIKQVGVYDDIMTIPKATESIVKHHNAQGKGNFSEFRRKAKVEGIEVDVTRLYFGSSKYDSKDMSVLINYIVEECKDQNIETLPPDEITKIVKEWKK